MLKPLAVVVALMALLLSAAGVAQAETPRFVDRGDGTVSDRTTGLIWMKNANCSERPKDLSHLVPQIFWQQAKDWAAWLENGKCGLKDKSEAGDWRLPTKQQWEAMIKAGCDPSISNDAGTGCYSDGPSSFDGLLGFFYWSDSKSEAGQAWGVALSSHGEFLPFNKIGSGIFVWPVRNGFLDGRAVVNGLWLYESGGDFVEKKDRVYVDQFAADSTRFVNWELNLTFPEPPTEKVTYKLAARYLDGDDSVLAEYTTDMYAEAAWMGSWQGNNWGSADGDFWRKRPGSYRLEVSSGDRVLAERSFAVVAAKAEPTAATGKADGEVTLVFKNRYKNPLYLWKVETPEASTKIEAGEDLEVFSAVGQLWRVGKYPGDKQVGDDPFSDMYSFKAESEVRQELSISREFEAIRSAEAEAAGRYVDNGDGTVRDLKTGLIWLQKANCKGKMPWSEAKDWAVNQLTSGECGLTDAATARKWRLPTKKEWEGMIKLERDKPLRGLCHDPAISDDAGTGCYEDGSSFSGVSRNWGEFWSATDGTRPGQDKPDPGAAWVVDLSTGDISVDLKTASYGYHVWPVSDP